MNMMSSRSRKRKNTETQPTSTEWDLPTLKDVRQMKLNNINEEEAHITRNDATREFYDARFYPYTKPGEDPVFAVINARNILICRIRNGKGATFELVKAITDISHEECHMYACAWTKDASGTPLLACAGKNATIRIYDVLKGTLSRTITGPGGMVNDLAVSPADPQILVSASTDYRATAWNLSPAWVHQPCMVVFAGIGGHRESLLSVSFHESGHYIVTGGEDKMVKVWRMPDYAQLQPGETLVIQYPVFSSSAIHTGHVECVRFYGDCLLSKAFEEGTIVMWKIEGFSSSAAPPPVKAHYVEKTLTTTFSDFSDEQPCHADGAPSYGAQFTRLLQFQVPNCNHLYMRFGLYQPKPGARFSHPVLSFCNSNSLVLFWDLARFAAYDEYINVVFPPTSGTEIDNIIDIEFTAPEKPSWLQITRQPARKPQRGDTVSIRSQLLSLPSSHQPFLRGSSPSSTSMNTGSSSTVQALLDARTKFSKEDLTRSRPNWDAMYAMNDPWRKLRAHKSFVLPSHAFTGRQVAWDPSGTWCVVSGSENIIVFAGR